MYSCCHCFFRCPKKVFDSLAAANIKRVFCTHTHTAKRCLVRLRLIEIKSAMLELFLFKSWLYDDITCIDYVASPFHHQQQHIHSWWMCERALLILDILFNNIHKQNIAIKCRSVLKLGQKISIHRTQALNTHTNTHKYAHVWKMKWWENGKTKEEWSKTKIYCFEKISWKSTDWQAKLIHKCSHKRASPQLSQPKWVSNFYIFAFNHTHFNSRQQNQHT